MANIPNCEEYQKRYEKGGNRPGDRIPEHLTRKSEVFAECFKCLNVYDAKDGNILVNYTDQSERELKLLADQYEVRQLRKIPYSSVKGVIISGNKIKARSFPFCPKLAVEEDELIHQMSKGDYYREWKEGVVISVWWNVEKMMISTSRRIDARQSRWFGSPTLWEMIVETGVDLSELDHSYNHVLLLQHPYMLMQSQEDIRPTLWHLVTYKRVKNADIMQCMKKHTYTPPKSILPIPLLTRESAISMWRRNYPIFVGKDLGGMIFMSEELIGRYDVVGEQRNVFIRYFTLGKDRALLPPLVPLAKKDGFDMYEQIYQKAISNLKDLLVAEIMGSFPAAIKSHQPVIKDAMAMLGVSYTKKDVFSVVTQIIEAINPLYLYTLSCCSHTRCSLSAQVYKGTTLGDLSPELQLWIRNIFGATKAGQNAASSNKTELVAEKDQDTCSNPLQTSETQALGVTVQ